MPSGLPTYRGKDGLWTLKTEHEHPMLIATKAYFEARPEECWKRSFVFSKKVERGAPNNNHKAIFRMQEHCRNQGIEFTLVTQNIDGYHADLIRQAHPSVTFASQGSSTFGFTDGVFEIHGNIHYMRCSRDSCPDPNLYQAPPFYTGVPTCKTCGGIMQRHTLMFDQKYSEQHYRSHTVMQKARASDLLMVVGTELKTRLPDQILQVHIGRGVPIIEFNLGRWVDKRYGELMSVEGLCEETVPAFVDKYLALAGKV